MTKILLVGGPRDIRPVIERQLRVLPGEVIEHWLYREKDKTGILPHDTQLVYLLTDMASHNQTHVAVMLAKARNVPVVYATRKWSISAPRVYAALAGLN